VVLLTVETTKRILHYKDAEYEEVPLATVENQAVDEEQPLVKDSTDSEPYQ
jgi:hypothetical protein